MKRSEGKAAILLKFKTCKVCGITHKKAQGIICVKLWLWYNCDCGTTLTSKPGDFKLESE